MRTHYNNGKISYKIQNISIYYRIYHVYIEIASRKMNLNKKNKNSRDPTFTNSLTIRDKCSSPF